MYVGPNVCAKEISWTDSCNFEWHYTRQCLQRITICFLFAAFKDDWYCLFRFHFRMYTTRAGIAQSVRAGRFGDRIPVGTRFSASFQTVGTGSFPGVKRPGRGVDHLPPSSTEVKKKVELYLHSLPGPSSSVMGWILCIQLWIQNCIFPPIDTTSEIWPHQNASYQVKRSSFPRHKGV
jgi:hypothetical protein